MKRPALKFFLLLGTLLLFSLFSPLDKGHGTELEPVAIQLRWFHQFQFAGYYAAVEKGFYADEGLRVILREYQPREDRLAPLLEGKVQYGVGDPALLKLRLEGEPVVVLAQIFQHSAQVLVSKKERSIFAPEDLVGRKVMLATTTVGSVPIRAMILDALGDLESITVVPHRSSYSDFLGGHIDAMVAYLSNEPFRFKKMGVHVNIMDPRGYGIDFYGDNLFTVEKEIRDHPERVEKVIRATRKGWEYALEHKDEMIRLIRSKYNPTLDDDQLRYEAKIIDQLIVPDLVPVGEIDPGRYARIAETYRRLGLSETSAVPEGFLYDPSLRKTTTGSRDEKAGLSEQPDDMELTPRERAWIESNSRVRVFSTDHAPFMTFKGGKPSGIFVDLLHEISGRTGIAFDIGDPRLGFPSAMKGLTEKTGPDVIAGLNPTPEREKVILFTKPFVSSPKFIFTRDDAPFVHSMGSLSGETVAVVDGYVTHELLARDYPEIDLLIHPSNEEALRAVCTGRAFAFIGSLLATSSMINQFGLTNLKASVPSALPDAAVGLGVRIDWPELRSIMDKVMDAIPHSEKAAMINKWSSVKVEYAVDPADIFKLIAILAAGASGIVLLTLFWNRKLADQVRRRTSELEAGNRSLAAEVARRREAEKLLRESGEYLQSLMDSLPDAVFSIKLPERVIEWANDTHGVFGYEPREYLGRTTEFLYPDKEDWLHAGDRIEEAIAQGKEVLAVEQPMRKKGGELFPADIKLSLFMVDGKVARVTGIVRNVADRKEAERKMRQYQERLKALASQLTLAAENERRAVAADLHDHVGHSLALARIQLDAVLEAPSDLRRNILIKDVSNLLLEALQDTRHLISELSTPSTNGVGLGDAVLEWMEEQVEKRHGLRTRLIDTFGETHGKALDENARTLMLRNVRELLVNVVKHARAETVSVRIFEEAGMLKVVVEDDGAGFDPGGAIPGTGANGGFGLFSIQERMTDLGGSLDIESRPGKGCRTTLTLPLGEARR